jgi:hypothetical protein
VSARGALLAGALAIGALASVVAHATVIGDYGGHVKGEPASFLSFDVERTATGKKKVRRIFTGSIPFDCEVGTPGVTPPMKIKGAFRIAHRRFHGKGETVVIAFDPTGKIRGQFRKGGRARGTIRLFGELDTNPGSDCDTGVVEWRAEKNPLASRH